MNFLVTFTLLSIFNVTFSTARSIVTVKGGKVLASLASGGYFAFYNIMLIYTVQNFPLWQKCLITAICNIIGVFLVKLIEEKMRKDRLWKVEATIPTQYIENVDEQLRDIPHSYIEISSKHTLFNFYCATQKESIQVKEICDQYGAKYFATEAKIF